MITLDKKDISDYSPCELSSNWRIKDFGDNLYQRLERRIIIDVPFSNRTIISYGLIVYSKDTRRWLLVQRKHTVEFLLIMKGMYRFSQLPFLVNSITKKEAEIVERCIKDSFNYFNHVYSELKLHHETRNYSYTRLMESKNIILSLLSRADLSKNKLSWTWPKGLINSLKDKETPFQCAKREFYEEVEVVLPDPVFISQTFIRHTTKTIYGKNIESRYWVYVIDHELPLTKPVNHLEVADRQWFDTNTCRSLLQHDDLFNEVVEIVKKNGYDPFCNSCSM